MHAWKRSARPGRSQTSNRRIDSPRTASDKTVIQLVHSGQIKIRASTRLRKTMPRDDERQHEIPETSRSSFIGCVHEYVSPGSNVVADPRRGSCHDSDCLK